MADLPPARGVAGTAARRTSGPRASRSCLAGSRHARAPRPRVASLPERARLAPEQAQTLDAGAIVSARARRRRFHAPQAPARQRLRRGRSTFPVPTTSASASRPTRSTGPPSSHRRDPRVLLGAPVLARPARDARRRRGRGRGPLRPARHRGPRLRRCAPLAEALRCDDRGASPALLQSHRGAHERGLPRAAHAARAAADSATRSRARSRAPRARTATSRAWSATSPRSTTSPRELLDYARLERGVPAIQVQSVPAEPWLEDVLADARNGACAPAPREHRADGGRGNARLRAALHGARGRQPAAQRPAIRPVHGHRLARAGRAAGP